VHDPPENTNLHTKTNRAHVAIRRNFRKTNKISKTKCNLRYYISVRHFHSPTTNMSDNFHQIPANITNFAELQGKVFIPGENEGVLYVKFVALSPQTLQDNPDLAGLVENQPGFIFVGDLQDVKTKLVEYFDDMADAYKASAEAFKETN
jgi:hypothetical protein